jgi:murein L,D-transpeptidase YcbB/YkuD
MRYSLPWLLLAGLLSPVTASGQDTVASTIEQLIGSARAPWSHWPDFAPHIDAVSRLYAGSPRTALWVRGGHLTAPTHAAIGALLAAGDHGLNPRDYDAELLADIVKQWVRVPLTAADQARFDVLLSVDLIRLLHDLRSGRLHRALLSSSMPTAARLDLGTAVSEALAGDSLSQLIAAVTPQLAQYRNLQRLLVRYRRLAADTTLRREAIQPVRPGEVSLQLPTLRRLLAAGGDLPSDSVLADVGEGLRRFQSRHGLHPTGVLDSPTTEALNTPFQRRVRQIELALERLRWLPPIGSHPFVVVNVPAFQLFAFDSVGGTGVPALAMKVIVGKALDKRTPVLLEQMRYVEFRPVWNVPRSILMEEIMPLLRRYPSYLSRHGMELVAGRDRVVGTAVTPERLDSLSRGELRVRQRPGGDNPLGATKFVFPNAANVYLHGTPRTELFAHTRRDFSHGCIRIENPTALAAWVLRDQPRWSRERIVAAQMAPLTSRAMLPRPMPVVVFYTTAVTTPDGRAWFYPDIYGHDRELDDALRAGPM